MESDQAPGTEITIRDALAADVPLLAQADSLAAAGHCGRRTEIEQWVTAAGTRLLLDAQQRRTTPRLFTSTNLSNHPMQRLLTRLGWQSAGIVYGLDEGDPELFFLAPATDTQLFCNGSASG